MTSSIQDSNGTNQIKNDSIEQATAAQEKTASSVRSVFSPPSSSSSQISLQISESPFANFPTELLAIIGAYANETFTAALPENATTSDDLVKDLMIAEEKAWMGFSDYLRGHRDSFSGKIYNQLLDQKKDQTIAQIVEMTFIEAEKKIKQNDPILRTLQRSLHIGLDPENLTFENCAFERIDHIAEEYLHRCDECLIQSVQENRHLPEPNQRNPKIVDYLEQLEREGSIAPEILGKAFRMAAYLGHLDCLNAIIRSQGFAEISPETLGWAFDNAAENGHPDCLEAISGSNRFDDISTQDLGWAVKTAALNGHPNCLFAIIRSNRFTKISVADLGVALRNAAFFGHLDCLNAIIGSNRFSEILAEDLGWALINSAERGILIV